MPLNGRESQLRVIREDGRFHESRRRAETAVVVCLVLTLWRGNLLAGLVAAVAIVAVARAVGVG